MDIQRYTKVCHKLDIRVSYDEDVEEKITRNMGGRRFNIHDELSLATPRSVEECYKSTTKAEEEIKRMQERQSKRRGGSSMRGRGGRSTIDFQNSSDKYKDKPYTLVTQGGYRGGYRGGRHGLEEIMECS